MKAFFSIVLFTAFLIQLGLRPIVVLNWKINQDRITEKYCENKNRPELECDGKCYLAKQLRKLDVEEQQERALSAVLAHHPALRQAHDGVPDTGWSRSDLYTR